MPRLTLAMIVKNEERYLDACLASVKDLVDEIVVVDTGSTDKTVNIAENFGAKIFRFEWINDFSAARNFALKNSTGEWILYLDADERLDPASINEIKIISTSRQKAAYYCTVKSLDRSEGRDNSMRYLRLFKNENGIEFRGKVHEQISYSLIENNYKIFQSLISIIHLGYNISPDEKKNKARRNLFLLTEEYSKSKTDYGAYQLANTYAVLNEAEQAIRYFLIAANSVNLAKNLKADSFCSLALIHHKNNETQKAEEYLLKSVQLNDKQPFACLLGAKISLMGNKLTEAEQFCRQSFDLSVISDRLAMQNEVLSRVEPEEVIYFGMSLAMLNRNLNNIQFYLSQLIKLFGESYSGEADLRTAVLQKLFESKNMNNEETECFEAMVNDHNINLFVSLIANNKDFRYKKDLLVRLHKKYSENKDVIKMLAVNLDEEGKTIEAIELLEKSEDENDPGVMLYLLSFYVKAEMPEKTRNILSRISSNKDLNSDTKQKLESIKSVLPPEYLNLA